jgi:hypothetical protein
LGQGSSTLRPSTLEGLYTSLVDIRYSCGLTVTFLFTKAEALETLAASQRTPAITPAVSEPYPTLSKLLSLPQEVRDLIYGFVNQAGKRDVKVRKHDFCRAIGDPRGVYFAFGCDSALLRVNWQIRNEFLTFAYRNVKFCLADVDTATQFLMMIGEIGRDNVTSIEFGWESPIDEANRWRESQMDPSANYLPHRLAEDWILPSIHADKCVKLLQSCGRLKHLVLIFDTYMVLRIPQTTFQNHPGILSLVSIGGLVEVEIRDLDKRSLDNNSVAKWLKERLGRRKDNFDMS